MTAPLDLRVLLLVVCASAAFTVLCPVIYRRDPLRRKWFLAALSATLLLAPWWSAAGLWRWPVGLEATFLEVLDQPVPWLALMVWWSVAALMMVRTAVRVGRGRRSLLALPLMNDAGIETECRRRATMLNLRRTVSIRMGPAPCASSLGALVMVLPAEASTWPSSQRRAVVSHELTHLQRLDDRLLLLVRLLVDWYWWMPWLSRLQRRYVEAMEESCDDLAARLAGGRAQYVSGLVAAARSLTGSSADSVTAPGQPIWAALLGHSHFASRVHRLLSVPGPSLDHADGRWTLLWASVAFAVVLTARPLAIQERPLVPEDWLPLTPHALSPQSPTYVPPRIETASFVHDRHTRTWREVPVSARDPLPIYPAQALTAGVEGEVVVELRLRRVPSGAFHAVSRSLASSDPSGVLAAAVERAFEHRRGENIGAGLRAVSHHYNDVLTPPPGSQLRLRMIYRFVPGSAGAGADPSSPGG